MNTEMLSLSNAHWINVTFREPAPAMRLEGRCEDAIGAELLAGSGCTIAVADGVGSGARGDVCSAAAVAHSLNTRAGEALQAKHVRGIFASADAAVRAELSRHTCARGATTLVGAWLDAAGAGVLGHCGDSRAYIARLAPLNPRVHRLTQDHSYRNLGLAAPRVGSCDDLARMLGLGCCDAADFHEFFVNPGDVLLSYTDGVHAHLPADWLESRVLESVEQLHGLDRGMAAERLAGLARSVLAQARLNQSGDDASIALAWRREVGDDGQERGISCRSSY